MLKPTATRNPLAQSASETVNAGLTPTASLPFSDIFNSSNWTGDAGKQIDVGRHYGGLGLGALMPDFQNQLGQVGQGIQQQQFARSQMNELGSSRGRANQVNSYGNQAQSRAYQLGRLIASRLSMNGIQGQEGAAQLSAANQAANETGNYASQLNSPESLGQIAQLMMQINSPDSIVSLASLLQQLDQQDFPRTQLHEQLSAAEKAQGGLGGTLGSLLGLATGGSGGLGSLASIFGGGGGGSIFNSNGSSGTSQTQVRNNRGS